MKRKVKLVYFSATGTTQSVILEIAKALAPVDEIVNLTPKTNRSQPLVFNREDLLILGLPVYAGRLPAFLADYLKGFEGNKTPLVNLVVYGNRAFDDALVELKDILEERGFINIAAAAFIGEHSYSKEIAQARPDSRDLELAFDLGLKLKELIKKEPTSIDPPGSRPYRPGMVYKGYKVETSSACIDCGLCSRDCPRQALAVNNRDIDLNLCILCSKCIKACPVQAKAILNEDFNNFLKDFVAKLNQTRQEPEFFF